MHDIKGFLDSISHEHIWDIVVIQDRSSSETVKADSADKAVHETSNRYSPQWRYFPLLANLRATRVGNILREILAIAKDGRQVHRIISTGSFYHL